MTAFEKLKHQLSKNERVDIISRRAFRFIFISFVLLFALSVLLPMAFLVLNGFDEKFLLFAATDIAVIFLIGVFYSHLSSISIKGDTIIFQSLFTKIQVGSIQCVRTVVSSNMLLFNFTSVRYNYDGKNYTVFVITRNSKKQILPEMILRTALQAA